jgi:DNA phosphorothioation-dependent restriction protein DptG
MAEKAFASHQTPPFNISMYMKDLKFLNKRENMQLNFKKQLIFLYSWIDLIVTACNTLAMEGGCIF